MVEIDVLMEKHAAISVEIGQMEQYLSDLRDDQQAIVARIKALVESKPTQFAFTQDKIEGAPTSSPSDTTSALEETAKIVAELGDGVTAGQLATRLGITQDAARLRLQRAEKKRLIRRVAFGRYSAKPKISSEAASNGKEPEETGKRMQA